MNRLELNFLPENDDCLTLKYSLPNDTILCNIESGFENYTKVCDEFNQYLTEFVEEWSTKIYEIFDKFDDEEYTEKTLIRKLIALGISNQVAKLLLKTYDNSASIIVSVAVVDESGEVVHTISNPNMPTEYQHIINLSSLITLQGVEEDE